MVLDSSWLLAECVPVEVTSVFFGDDVFKHGDLKIFLYVSNEQMSEIIFNIRLISKTVLVKLFGESPGNTKPTRPNAVRSETMQIAADITERFMTLINRLLVFPPFWLDLFFLLKRDES